MQNPQGRQCEYNRLSLLFLCLLLNTTALSFNIRSLPRRLMRHTAETEGSLRTLYKGLVLFKGWRLPARGQSPVLLEKLSISLNTEI